MLYRIKIRFLKVYNHATGSLAFMPLMIMLCFAITGAVLINLEDSKIDFGGLYYLSWAIIKDPTLASTIITTLLGGLISITVFSFSMVMVVITQASTQFTPRVIHYITRSRDNQFVLGFYIGAILYFIILLLNYSKTKGEFIVPRLAFSVGIIFGIISLLLFVRFIHTISLSVQVNNIILIIYNTVKARLNSLYKEDAESPLKALNSIVSNNKWFAYTSPQSGYIQNIITGIIPLLKEKDIILRLDLPAGEYILEGNPMYFLNKEIDEDFEKELAGYFNFSDETDASEHAHFAFVQITEIACKALSPGINDPGTARMCIDYLSDMLLLRSRLPDDELQYDDENKARLLLHHFTYSDIVKNTFTPIRHYGNNDVQILIKLLRSFYKLAQSDLETKKFAGLYNENAQAIIESAKHGLYNPADKSNFNQTVSLLNALGGYFHLPAI